MGVREIRFVRAVDLARCYSLSRRRRSCWRRAPSDFYKGRAINLYISYSTGGTYDFYAGGIGHHMGAHIPGDPTLVPRNLEGADCLRLADWLYRVAPQDASAFGHLRPRHRLRSAPDR